MKKSSEMNSNDLIQWQKEVIREEARDTKKG